MNIIHLLQNSLFFFFWGPSSLLANWYRIPEADHSPPPSAQVKNARSYTSTPQYIFMAWCLFKHRDKFKFASPFIFILSPNTEYSLIYYIFCLPYFVFYLLRLRINFTRMWRKWLWCLEFVQPNIFVPYPCFF